MNDKWLNNFSQRQCFSIEFSLLNIIIQSVQISHYLDRHALCWVGGPKNFVKHCTMTRAQISNRGRYSISNINQHLTNCQQMLKIWCIHLFLFCNVMKKIGAFMVYSLSFNLTNLNWPKEQSTSFRYLWTRATEEITKRGKLTS